ncbi:MAG: hypothetical protein IJJ26_01575 [Victivallales bacterium]|nr:hypothetical protein [Victivallales bacterium]
MKKCLCATLATLSGMLLMAAEPVFFEKNGTLKVDELVFRADQYDSKLKRNYTQGNGKLWEVVEYKADEASAVSTVSGVFRQPEEGEVPFTEKLERVSPGKYSFDISLQVKKLGGYGFRASLRGDEFLGRTFIINGKDVMFPLEPNPKSISVFSGVVSELVLPLKGSLVTMRFPQKTHIVIHDYRPKPNSFSVICNFDKPVDGTRKMHIDIETKPYLSQMLDLRKACNMGFQDDVADDKTGGWTDQGNENDLRMLKPQKYNFNGTDFQVIDPAKNGGKSCIVLKGGDRVYFPKEAKTEVAGGPKGNWLFLLHATAWGGREDEIGKVWLTYADGEEKAVSVRKRDVGNWWSAAPRANGEVVWTGENKSAYVGLYRSIYRIENKPITAIRFASNGDTVWMVVAASVGESFPPRKMSAPYYIIANKDWKPIEYNKAVEPGTVMDFRWRLDAPAGKYGPVVIRNGQFEFANRPGVAVRFYGTNLVGTSNYPDHEWSEKLADRLASFGFNMLRLHHHDGGMGKKENPKELDLDNMDKMDYLIAALEKRGIYITTDFYVSRRFPKGYFKEFPDGLTDIQAYKCMVWLRDDYYEEWKTFVKNTLAHKNKYNGGKTWANDPGMAFINLVNEGNIDSHWQSNPVVRQCYMDDFALWLKQKGWKDDADKRSARLNLFTREIYEKRYQQMAAFVKGLGLQCPISDQNMGCNPRLSQMRYLYDYVDTHGYFNHPSFPEKRWQLPSITSQNSPLAAFALPMPGWSAARVIGKPYAISEWCYSKPNGKRACGPILVGAYGALQNWDAPLQFAFGHGKEQFMLQERAGNHFDISTDVLQHFAHRIAVALFFDGGVKPAPVKIATVIPVEAETSPNQQFPGEFQRLGQIAQTGVILSKGGKANVPADITALVDIGFPIPKEIAGKLPVFKSQGAEDHLIDSLIQAGILPKGCYNSETVFTRSVGGAIEANRNELTFRVNAPTTEALVLPAGKAGETAHCRIKNKVADGTFAITAADGKPLEQSKHLLFIHLTDSQPSKSKYASDKKLQLNAWGEPPFLVARGEADVTLTLPSANWHLYAIRSTGKRFQELPLQKEDGAYKFQAKVFQPFGQVFGYELEAK